jgi:uncharacterized protein (DUF2267 family)
MFHTKIEFLEAIMRRADLKSMEETERVTFVVLDALNDCVGAELSKAIAETLPFDLTTHLDAMVSPGDAEKDQQEKQRFEDLPSEYVLG